MGSTGRGTRCAVALADKPPVTHGAESVAHGEASRLNLEMTDPATRSPCFGETSPRGSRREWWASRGLDRTLLHSGLDVGPLGADEATLLVFGEADEI